MKVDGIDYKRNVGVYDMTDDLPKVGQITYIYVINHNTVILLSNAFQVYYMSSTSEHTRCRHFVVIS